MTRYAISRRSRSILVAICLLAAISLFAVDRITPRHNRLYQPTSHQQQNADDLLKYNGKTFLVTKVVDGDTIDIDVPDGNYSHTRIRLWGIDTPETKDPRTGPMYFGKEASEFTTKLSLGKEVTVLLEQDRNSRDKYHRLLAYIQLPDKTFLNEVLLSEGFAYADLRFKHALYNKYKQLESAAKNQKKGLWAGVTFDQMPQWRQKRERASRSTSSEQAAETAEVNN